MEWISVKKDLPKELTHDNIGLKISSYVLGYDGETMFVCYHSKMKDSLIKPEWVMAHGWNIDGSPINPNVTHWMPLPQKP